MKKLVSHLLSLGAVTFAFAPVFGQTSGSLDPSFDGDGISTVPVFAASIRSAAMQSDGKALALFSAAGVIELIRSNPDGGPDLSFGDGDGVATHTWPAADGRYGTANVIALQNNGGVEKIIVAGWTYITVRRSAVVVLRVDRYMPDGSLDNSFGTGGSFIYQTGYAGGVAVQPDGKILTTGGETLGPLTLVRLLPNGGLDPGFGSGGIVNILNIVHGRSIAVQSDGKVVVVGTSNLSGKGNKTRLTVARFNANGTIDPSFGTSGRTVIDFSGVDTQGRTVLIDPDGSIVVGGRSGDLTSGNIALARLHSNGLLDSSFSLDGRVTFDFGGSNDNPFGLARQSDGKILVGGDSALSGYSTFSLVRFDSAGNLDTTFGSGGIVTTDVFGLGDSYGRTVLIQPNAGNGEKVVMTGLARSGAEPFWHAATLRYLE
jgi:uncharacterized delta-60 repeat protein